MRASPRPDGMSRPADLWREDLAAFPTDDKVELALELDRRVRAGDPRIRQVSSRLRRRSREMAIATSRGIAVTSRRTRCYLFVHLVAGDGDGAQTGFGYRWTRSSRPRPRGGRNRCRPPATRLLGAKKAKSAKLTAVLDRRVTATLLGVLSGTLSGEEVAKGRSLFEGRVGETVGVSELTLVDDPTNPLAYGASRHDVRRARLPAQFADSPGRAQGLPLRHLRRPARRHGVDRFGGAAAASARRRASVPGPCLCFLGITTRRDHREGVRGFPRPVDHGRPLRCQPGERRLLRRCARA